MDNACSDEEFISPCGICLVFLSRSVEVNLRMLDKQVMTEQRAFCGRVLCVLHRAEVNSWKGLSLFYFLCELMVMVERMSLCRVNVMTPQFFLIF